MEWIIAPCLGTAIYQWDNTGMEAEEDTSLVNKRPPPMRCPVVTWSELHHAIALASEVEGPSAWEISLPLAPERVARGAWEGAGGSEGTISSSFSEAGGNIGNFTSEGCPWITNAHSGNPQAYILSHRGDNWNTCSQESIKKKKKLVCMPWVPGDNNAHASYLVIKWTFH